MVLQAAISWAGNVSRKLFGGAEGTRTPDPLHAMQVRYQLRHSPEVVPAYRLRFGAQNRVGMTNTSAERCRNVRAWRWRTGSVTAPAAGCR